MRSSVLAAVAVVGMGTASEAAAAPANYYGGRTGERQGYVVAGYPFIEGGVYLPMGPLELKPRFRFSYDTFGALRGYSVGFEPGVGIRFPVVSSGDFSGAVVGTVSLNLLVGPSSGMSIDLLDPGFMGTFRIEDVVDINFGATFEPVLGFAFAGGPVWFSGRLMFRGGVEYEVTDGIVIGFNFGFGPEFRTGFAALGFAGLGVGGVGFNGEGHVGAGFTF
ncbi:MAG: hypothetical protein KC656_07440 [Myxococcales bacterium]|nr:hypothetical protein [Myxococcales bacterium]